MASKQARKRKQVCTTTWILESKHRRIRHSIPDNIGEGGDVGASHSTARGCLINSSDCVTLRTVVGESAHLHVHHAIPAIKEAGDALAAYDPACMMDLTPQHQRLIRTASHSCNFQLLGAAQAEGPDQPAVVLPLVGAAQLQAGELALAINAMPPAPPVQEYHNAVVTGAPNLAADLDMIHPILHIVDEASNFQPMGAAYEEGPVRTGTAGLLLVGAAAQLIQEAELARAFNGNAMPAAPPVQDHNAVLAGALNLMAADRNMIHQPIPLPQVPGALGPVAVELQFKEWKHVILRDDTLKRESTQEFLELLLEENL